jgi:hypothetical protein
MGAWDDDTAVQRKAQLRLLSSLPALRLQDSPPRADAPGIAHHPVPEVQRSLRRDARPETHQHLLSAAHSATAYTGVPCQTNRHCPGKPRLSSRQWIVFVSRNCPADLNGLMRFYVAGHIRFLTWRGKLCCVTVAGQHIYRQVHFDRPT